MATISPRLMVRSMPLRAVTLTLPVARYRNLSLHDILREIGPRVEMLREVSSGFSNVEVDAFDGLLTDYARRRQGQGAGRLARSVGRCGVTRVRVTAAGALD